MRRLQIVAPGIVALGILAFTLLFSGTGVAADKYSELKFTVVREGSDRPVRDASIVLHPVDEKGKQDKGGLQLKTNADGQTEFRGAPYGKLRIQVIARGFQTYGHDYEINQPVQHIVIKLKRPQDQYSIYEDRPEDGNKRD